MKTKKKRGNVGLRLKTNDPNLLENYTKYRKNKTPKKKKKKKRKTKSSVRKIIVQEKKIDPLLKIIEDTEKNGIKDDLMIEEKEERKDEKKKDEGDRAQIKSIRITGNMEPDKDKIAFII